MTSQQVEMESHVEMVRGEVACTILTSERLENKLAEAERKAAELARSRSPKGGVFPSSVGCVL